MRQLCHWVEYQFEPFGLSYVSRGKIGLTIKYIPSSMIRLTRHYLSNFGQD